jgi:tetratricopeptide (TPR) repeat protein
MRAKAIKTEPLRITARQSEWTPTTTSPFTTGVTLISTKATTTEPLRITAIRVNPNYVEALTDRGLAYAVRGDTNRAIADYNEAIRLNPNYALAFCNRGKLKLLRIKDASGNADIAKARELNASICP